MVDFAKESPTAVGQDYPATQALELLRRSSDQLLLVFDGKQHFLGLVSSDQLNSQEIIKKISSGHNREDLTVMDFLQGRNTVKALNVQDVAKVTIGDVMFALMENGLKHCLVVDESTQRIRAVISAKAIATKLGLTLNQTQSVSFSDIAAVIYRQSNPDPRPLYAVS